VVRQVAGLENRHHIWFNEIEEKIGNANQKVFDLELNTTKIEETISENGKKILNIEDRKEKIEKDVI
jgi:hypothetical protein